MRVVVRLKGIDGVLRVTFIFAVALLSTLVQAQPRESLHLIIPGGAGGGWDTTARGMGGVLMRTGLVKNVSYENLSGGGGSKAIAHLIETARRQQNTLMVSSFPILLIALKNISPQSYRDLTPVAAVIADYGAFVVVNNSKYRSWQHIMADFMIEPRRVKMAGGSIKGGMDHIVAALAIEKSGGDVRQLRYIPYDAGGKAMIGLLSGETQVLSTGLSEALALAKQGEVRIVAMTADKRVAGAPDVPTIRESGVDMTFANWRGVFAVPDLSAEKVEEFQALLQDMKATKEWKALCQKRGWSDLYMPQPEFIRFLATQEQEMAAIMKRLGFIR